MKKKLVLFSRNQESFSFLSTSLNGRYELLFRSDLCDVEDDISLAVIDVPMGDPEWIAKGYDLAEACIGTLLITSDRYYRSVAEEAVRKGVMVIRKPVTPVILDMAVSLSEASVSRLLKLQKRNQSLKERLSDVSLVNRAKWLLIENMNMSEEEAHHYIEKQSMDTSLSLREVASNIIRTYSR